jgi:hypothetical protein
MGNRCRAWTLPAGFILDGPWGRVASANITPDPSGISYYDQAMFTQVIRTGFARARKLNQIMRWHTYRGMTDEDIVAMFAYIRTFKPVRHHVDNTESPTFCKVCRQTHGGGNQIRCTCHSRFADSSGASIVCSLVTIFMLRCDRNPVMLTCYQQLGAN